MDISGKKVIVTGGGSGYGLGIAKVLKDSSAEIWITGRDQGKLDKAAAEYGFHTITADAADEKDWDRVFASVPDADILINNAGFGGRIAPVAEQDAAGIQTVIATNLTGVIIGCSKAAQHMIPRKSGMIINISSVCALYAWPGWSVYTAAKAGLAKFSHGLYTELRPHGIRVTCVTPSWGQTNFNRAASISGASEDPSLAEKCTAPEELGQIILDLIKVPDHLAVPDVTIQPMIQDINPM